MGAHTILSIGGCTILMMKFKTKDAIAILKKGYANCIIGVPALFNALLSRDAFYGPWLAGQNTSFVGGDAVPESLLDRWNDTMAKYGQRARLFEGYGLSETCAVANVNYRGHEKNGTVGQCLDGLKEIIIDTETLQPLPPNKLGEICISGNTVMTFPAVFRVGKDFKESQIFNLIEPLLIVEPRTIINDDQLVEVATLKEREEWQHLLVRLVNGNDECLFHTPY